MVNNSTSLLFLALYHKGTCVHHQHDPALRDCWDAAASDETVGDLVK